MFQSLGAPELLIILAIVVVLFGATRIGDIGKGIGRGIRDFRRELKDDDKPEEGAKDAQPPAPVPTVTSSSSHTPDDQSYNQH
ncbi:MAG: twin-arginine translocase TatA/TatE family subunit [Dehalococcoidia bacterium]|nr:twin-arginine translocase TatA/TatE family subunit [Dehalococcoidia bacterium]